MALAARTRWILYGVAGLATLAAMRWVDQRSERPVVVAATTTRASAPLAVRTQPAASDTQVRLDWLKRRPGEDVPRSDPFSAQGPGMPTQPPVEAAPAPAPPPPPPQAPPLPFTYLGKWTEKGQTTVFLSRGERHVSVRGPGKLDETYAVESIDERQIVLNYLPLGIRQSLALVPGAPPVQAAGAAPEAAEESTEEQN